MRIRFFRRFLTTALAALLLLGAAGCSGGAASGRDAQGLDIVCTIFPQYDWLCHIMGERAGEARITLLLDNGIDMHSFQPSAGDIAGILASDMFIYVGGESDAWAREVLRGESDTLAVSLLDTLGGAVRQEETVAGMQAESGAEGEPESDEHIWLSLRNAELLCRSIAEELGRLDPQGAAEYAANADAYIAELSALDDEYAAAVAGAKRHTLLFGDRFPFRYLAEDYGLEYYAAFPGCSAETEASFETVVFLAGKCDELGIDDIIVIDGSDSALAETIASNTASGARGIVTLNSMQSVTAEDIAAGTSYISVMRDNLEALKAALN